MAACGSVELDIVLELEPPLAFYLLYYWLRLESSL